MTPEELERVMNFIIERQERMTAQQEQQQFFINTLLDSQNTLTATVTRIAETQGQQIATQGRQIAAQGRQIAAQGRQIAVLTDNLGKLSATVDRYIHALGNGSNNGSS